MRVMRAVFCEADGRYLQPYRGYSSFNSRSTMVIHESY
jgi:hypothetical protein